jgi:transcriptional regulator with XRE-family HTH domain
MDVVRIGLSIRALRRRRRWTQQRLAQEAELARSTIARIETGHADQVTGRFLTRVAAALGATVSVRVLWHGESLDRLLDASHADLTNRVLELLDDLGWQALPEVSYNNYGERGSIDILAFHPPTRSLLVIEIKSVVPDLQSMLGTLDRKARIALAVARGRGWQASSVSRLLVLPDDRTARRRVDRHRMTFDTVLPARTAAVRRWLAAPTGRLAGILFLSDVHHTVTRHRVSAVAGRDRAGPGARRDTARHQK